MFTMVDFFCGCGGMGLGFEKAGFSIVQAFDWDKWAVESYNHNLKRPAQVADVSRLHGSDILPASAWTFGFPCQDVSIAGKKEGITGKRSKMFFQVMRLLSETENKPKILLAENVEQIRNSLPIIAEEYMKVGYTMYAQLLNAKYFNVPQSRERYFIVGIRNDLVQDFVFPEQLQETAFCMGDALESDVPESFDFKYMDNYVALTKPDKDGIRVVGDLRHYGNDQMNRVYDPEGISPTLLVVSGGGREIKVIHENRVRKMTPREYARLQGFPDSFEIIVTKSQAYKQFGNAVAVPQAYAMANSVKDYLNREAK